MNIVRLQQYATAIHQAVQMGKPSVVGAKLIPSPDAKTIQMMLFVHNVHRGAWLEETQMVELVQRVSAMTQVPLTYAGHAIVGRSHDMFAPYTDVELFAIWRAQGQDDPLLNDPVASQGVSMIENGDVYLWGWVPGHVLETVGDMVKIKTMREIYSLNASGDTIMTIPYNAPWLRLAREPSQVGAQAGDSGVTTRA